MISSMEKNNAKSKALSAEWVTKSLEYHGQPLQKVWEGEHGIQSLHNIGVRNPDFTLYHARQKQFVFQDRAKRLKIHSFIAKKANELFPSDPAKECARSNNSSTAASIAIPLNGANATTGFYAEIPPLNVFFPESVSKTNIVKKIYSQLKVGDIIYGKIQNPQPGGCLIRLLCTQPPNFHVFNDVKARAFLPHSLQVPAIDNKGITRGYVSNDLVCCEIVEVNELSEKLVVGMKGQFSDRHKSNNSTAEIKLGLAHSNQLPDKYKFSTEVAGRSYESVLEESIGFDNPRCIEHLYELVGLDSTIFYTNMSGLRGKYPNDEYSSELRQSQASSWAFRSVADGIEHFKEGRHAEAFQCLNKALTIDPRNVEGLVARGALYANNGSLKKAVEDFEYALKINPNHSNARKYMGETLVALGRNYEEENCPEEAKKAYQDCLTIIPHHEEAQKSLNFLWNKGSGTSKQIIDMNDLALPALSLKMADQNRGDTSSALSGSTNADARKESSSSKKGKKKKSKSRKRHSSSSSSNESSESSDSSSSESSSSTDSSSSSDSDRSKSKKKKKRSDKSKQRSMSPLSRRMAMFSGNVDGNHVDAAGLSGSNAAYNYPQMFSGASGSEAGLANDYDLRVNKFLDMTRDEDNYEEKVRKFVEEASKYKKERKNQESKKKDRKKSKKNKKDSKKKKKEKKSKSSKKDKEDVIDGNELREALKLITKLPIFDLNAKKLSEIEMVEKSLNQLKEEEKKRSSVEKKPEEAESKWKMMFPKESKKEASASKYAFPNEDEEQEDPMNISKQNQYGASSSHASASYQTSKYESSKQIQLPSHPPPTLPPVLDKFGTFRRAEQPDVDKPPEPPAFRSRSHSRTRSSRSYSRSRSRSRSYGRRHRSRSYSPRRRSYSRSRSRSSSRNRRRVGYQYNNRPRYFNNNNRGGNRFNNNRGFQNRDFRNNRNRWNNNRNGWNNNRGRNRNWRSRSRSYSRSRSPYDRRNDSPNHQPKPPSPPPQEAAQPSDTIPAPN